MLSPSQHQRLCNIAECSLFQHFHPLSTNLLSGLAVDVSLKRLSAEVPVDKQELNSLGLVPASHLARLMEDAVVMLGYILSGELMVPVRLEADYLHTAGLGDVLRLEARGIKRHVNLHAYEVDVSCRGRTLSRARVSALEMRRFPPEMSEQLLRAAAEGVLNASVLLEFVHLMDAELYLEARRLTQQFTVAERIVPAAPSLQPPEDR